MSAQLKFAIVGCGKIAPRHAAEAAKNGELAAVCDIIKERADDFAKQFSCRPYYSIESLLENETDIDVVAICTPNGLHAEHSIQCLNASHHVLCEKPLCISTGEAKEMIETSLANNKKLFVVKSTRYNPALLSLKTLIDNNELGKLYSFQLNCFWNRPPTYYANSWKGTKDLDGGTLYTQFSHYIDALIWLVGDISEVKGFRENKSHKEIIEFEDSGVVSIQMVNGMLGGLNWTVNTYQKNMEVSLSIIAEKGSLRIAGEYMNKIEYQFTSSAVINIADDGNANDYGSYKGSMSNHDKVYENLVKALQDDQHPFTNANDGLKTVEAIERIYNSIPLL